MSKKTTTTTPTSTTNREATRKGNRNSKPTVTELAAIDAAQEALMNRIFSHAIAITEEVDLTTAQEDPAEEAARLALLEADQQTINYFDEEFNSLPPTDPTNDEEETYETPDRPDNTDYGYLAEHTDNADNADNEEDASAGLADPIDDPTGIMKEALEILAQEKDTKTYRSYTYPEKYTAKNKRDYRHAYRRWLKGPQTTPFTFDPADHKDRRSAAKEAQARQLKYSYPEGFTTAQKAAFRKEARKAARKALKDATFHALNTAEAPAEATTEEAAS